MQIEAASRLQYPVHLKDTDTEPAEERAHVVACARVRGLYDTVQGGMVTEDCACPFRLHVSPRPHILVLNIHTGSGDPLKCPDALVERRVSGNEVDTLGTNALEDGQVIRNEQVAIECLCHYATGSA